MIDPTTVPPKLSRIERLMSHLDAVAGKPEDRLDGSVQAMAGDARQLILDLLGMSDLPVGESLYDEAMRRIRAEVAAEETLTGSAEELRGALLFTKHWVREIWPANTVGQVPFERAIYEHLADAVKLHLDKEHKGDLAGTTAVED